MAPEALLDRAEQALARMRAKGFDAAQACASFTQEDELNLQHNEPSLLRSTEVAWLSLVGLVDGRRASTDLSELDDAALAAAVDRLYADAVAAPQDDANAISAGERARIAQGPHAAEPGLLAAKMAELLAFRERETPRMMLEEGAVAHALTHSQLLTSGGTDLACSVGWYTMSAMGTAREGQRSSSFNYTGGTADELAARQASDYFGIAQMLRATEQQIHTRPIAQNFVGEVVLMPSAVADLLGWLQGQLGDVHLIAGSSLYRDRVGQRIASPLLDLRSRFDAPGVAAVSSDGFAASPVAVLKGGVLQCLTPSYYGSRKTGIAHVPVASAGWEVAAGETPLATMIGAVPHGALVGRLSMGNPAANGDFSGVIKNSFEIVDGQPGAALAEVMITGNMARMLNDVSAVSRERIDTGTLRLPWLRIGGLHFS